MADRASLKRKLEVLDKEQRDIRERLRRIEVELEHHRLIEMQLFLKRRCPRIVQFSENEMKKCILDNNLVLFIDTVVTNAVYLYDDTERIAAFDTHFEIRLNDRSFASWDLGSNRLTRLVDVLPDLDRLVHVHLPAWLKASKELDVESLMTSRVLRWISKQVGGQWPDIITGNFPLK